MTLGPLGQVENGEGGERTFGSVRGHGRGRLPNSNVEFIIRAYPVLLHAVKHLRNSACKKPPHNVYTFKSRVRMMEELYGLMKDEPLAGLRVEIRLAGSTMAEIDRNMPRMSQNLKEILTLSNVWGPGKVIQVDVKDYLDQFRRVIGILNTLTGRDAKLISTAALKVMEDAWQCLGLSDGGTYRNGLDKDSWLRKALKETLRAQSFERARRQWSDLPLEMERTEVEALGHAPLQEPCRDDEWTPEMQAIHNQVKRMPWFSNSRHFGYKVIGKRGMVGPFKTYLDVVQNVLKNFPINWRERLVLRDIYVGAGMEQLD